ncbi:MAG TPA: type II toxin-antitoxin system Phd/YefM family antitoxin [Terriglobales bacterium]|nr:type II toxin-antitoxin system Phd/YefM family antitoxin [Terriglobales bacterium]
MPQAKRKQQPKSSAVPPSSRKPPQKWQLQTAKAQFSEVFRRARTEGPQHVTKAGKEEVVIIPVEEFERLTEREKKSGDIVDFFRNSPLMEVDLDIRREEQTNREIDL